MFPTDNFRHRYALFFRILTSNRPTVVSLSSDSRELFVRQLSDEKFTAVGRKNLCDEKNSRMGTETVFYRIFRIIH